jgi:hypothetical protein
MKKLTLLFALFFMTIIGVTQVKAQDDSLDDLKFEDEIAPDEIKPPFMGIGTGYSYSMFFGNNDAVNNKLTEFGFKKDAISSPLSLHGFEIFTSLPVANLPITLGFSHRKGSQELDFEVSEGLTRRADYSMSFTGIILDYSIVPFNKMAISFGLEMGEGSMNFSVYQNEAGIDWGNLNPDTKNNNFYHNARVGFLYFEPKIDIEYKLTDWIITRINAGYNFTIDETGIFNKNTWEYNGSAGINNAPTDFDSKGMFLQLGVFIGLFTM